MMITTTMTTMMTTLAINKDSYTGLAAAGGAVARREHRINPREVTFGKVTRWKVAIRTLLDARVLVEGRRGPIGRHRVGARASREWPRGEKRKGSPRVAPPAAGGGKCLSLSFPLFSRSLVRGASVGAALRTVCPVDHHHQHRRRPSPSHATIVGTDASVDTNTIDDTSCRALRLASS